MHYGLVAIGSRGDVQPLLALALGLRAINHQVIVVAHENFKDFVESYGISFKPLTGNIEEVLHSPEAKKVLQSGSSIAMLRYIEKIGRENQAQINQDILKGCEGVDVVVTGALGVLWVSCVAEKMGKKWAVIQLSFPVTPTKEFPFAGMDYFNAPRYNLFTYWLLLKAYWRINKKAVNEFRDRLGLPILQKSIFEKISSEKIPTLYCVSPNLINRPSDWNDEIKMTGFLTLPKQRRESNAAEINPEELRTWLSQGEKPIYIGFGSMPVPDPEKFNKILSGLLEKTSQRYIFCYGWSGISNSIVNDRLFCLPYVNHEWLLPQCKAAVIHGGVGTVGAALKAGIPVIIISVFGDQPWWGKLMEKRKLCVHIPFRGLTEESLLRTIEKIQSANIQNNALGIGNLIQQEDGLTSTIQALEEYFN